MPDITRTKIVRYTTWPTETDLASLRAAGVQVVTVSTLVPEVTVRVPIQDPAVIRGLVEVLRMLPSVLDVEDDFEVRHTLVDVAPLLLVRELWSSPPVVSGIHSTVFAARNPGEGIKVAIIDTGIDLAYPGFSGRVVVGKDYTGTGSVQDGHGHGTHVAGLVGMTVDSDAAYVGMAPHCMLLIYKALDNNGSGSAADIAAAIEQALADGADIISMSLGGEATSSDPDFLERRTDAAAQRIPVFVASGNSGPATPFRQTPARAVHAITVGASTKQDGIATFTSRGITDDGRIKPNCYVPGHLIGSAKSSTGGMGKIVPGHPTIVEASGTSMACPIAAGLAAVLLALDPSLKGKPGVVKAIFMRGGRVIAGAEGPRVVAPELIMRPYPPAGQDRRQTEPAPTPPAPEPAPIPELPPSDCEGLWDELLGDAELRRLLLRRLIPAVRREVRRVMRVRR